MQEASSSPGSPVTTLCGQTRSMRLGTPPKISQRTRTVGRSYILAMPTWAILLLSLFLHICRSGVEAANNGAAYLGDDLLKGAGPDLMAHWRSSPAFAALERTPAGAAWIKKTLASLEILPLVAEGSLKLTPQERQKHQPTFKLVYTLQGLTRDLLSQTGDTPFGPETPGFGPCAAHATIQECFLARTWEAALVAAAGVPLAR